MLVSEINEKNLTDELIDRLLFRELNDSGADADCIIVLGSIKAAQYRVPVAADAFKAGRALKIMLCGGKIRDFSTGKCTEAEHMYNTALELGIPKESLIIENSSQNTIENILFALTELQRTFSLNHVHRVLLVTTAYHMRRSLEIARYLFPEHITVMPCPANDTNTRRDNWMNTTAGTARVKTEAMKIVACVLDHVIPDFDV